MKKRTMKARITVLMASAILLGVGTRPARAATNEVSTLLQKGLFEEEANQNLDAAIQAYQGVIAQTEKNRQYAATAIFRLGECYRKEGKTNEANVQYQRILSEFPDETELAKLSRSYLGNTAGNPAAGGTSLGALFGEAATLARQIAGIEKLKADPEEEARGVAAIFPDDGLKKMLENFQKLYEQAANTKTNPGVGTAMRRMAFGPDGVLDQDAMANVNRPDFAEFELQRQLVLIQERVDFIMGIQEARLKVLQGGEGVSLAQAGSNGEAAPVGTDEEEQDIKRIQEMIQNSPDLINAPPGNAPPPPLSAAAQSDWLRVARYLLDHQARVDVLTPGNYDETPLITAAENGHKAMVELLLERGADINAKDKRGMTALHLAAQHGFQAVVETLIAHRADVNAQDENRRTPLAVAAAYKRDAVVQQLLQAARIPIWWTATGRRASPMPREAVRQNPSKCFWRRRPIPMPGSRRFARRDQRKRHQFSGAVAARRRGSKRDRQWRKAECCGSKHAVRKLLCQWHF